MSADERAYREYVAFCEKILKIPPAPFQVWERATHGLSGSNYATSMK